MAITTMRKQERGFTIIEVLLVIGFIAILGSIAMVTLFGTKEVRQLNSTAEKMATLLREAASRSMQQADNVQWGVRFSNEPPTPFYALFKGSYSIANRKGYYTLPKSVIYEDPAVGLYREVTFDQISGKPNQTISVKISLASDQSVSSTIALAATGAVSYHVNSVFGGGGTVVLPPPGGNLASSGEDRIGGTAICTELHRQGLLSDALYAADKRYAATVDPLVRKGYLLWARPVVQLMRRSPIAAKIVHFFAAPWAQEMAYEMHAVPRGSFWGKVMMAVGKPASKVLGITASYLDALFAQNRMAFQ
ncbi:type II secretion system protein [Candidatus Parcubacteria bacterium]|nr:MAG: type II secretion system protein [Candidatus Parcubacteria bacterium]